MIMKVLIWFNIIMSNSTGTTSMAVTVQGTTTMRIIFVPMFVPVECVTSRELAMTPGVPWCKFNIISCLEYILFGC